MRIIIIRIIVRLLLLELLLDILLVGRPQACVRLIACMCLILSSIKRGNKFCVI